MSDVLKRILCLALALVVVFSFAGCRKSPASPQMHCSLSLRLPSMLTA